LTGDLPGMKNLGSWRHPVQKAGKMSQMSPDIHGITLI
jgi:hypothetical protein